MNGLKSSEFSTVIGRGATLRGELVSTEDVVIEGAVDGVIKAAGARLTVAKDARVKADIVAQEVVVMGQVEGTIRATERAELRAGALVTGDVYAKRFAMEQDAVLRGRVDPTRAGEAVGSAEPVATPEPVAAPVTPVTAGPTPTLFGGPTPVRSGLAAAARTFGQAGQPAGLNALSEPNENDGESA